MASHCVLPRPFFLTGLYSPNCISRRQRSLARILSNHVRLLIADQIIAATDSVPSIELRCAPRSHPTQVPLSPLILISYWSLHEIRIGLVTERIGPAVQRATLEFLGAILDFHAPLPSRQPRDLLIIKQPLGTLRSLLFDRPTFLGCPSFLVRALRQNVFGCQVRPHSAFHEFERLRQRPQIDWQHLDIVLRITLF